MKLNDLKEKKLSDLKEIAKTMGIEKISSMSKDELMKAMVSAAPKEEKETSSADVFKELPKPIQKEKKKAEKAASKTKLEEGEIIFNFEKDGIPEPELVLSDTIGKAYLFNGKHLRFYNIDQNRIIGITYMELEKSLYLVYDNNCFKLELNRSPQKFIQEKDEDIIRYLMME